jgi:tRNA(Ser,Leu) C12 N-acetylase TAN1
MKDWNVIITIFQDGYRRANRTLHKLGPIERSPYHNVLLMSVADPVALLGVIERYDAISRGAPTEKSFEFHSSEDFLAKAKETVVERLPHLAGRSFHVRLHRRGSKQSLRSPDAERSLGEALLDALKEAGTPGTLSFSGTLTQ